MFGSTWAAKDAGTARARSEGIPGMRKHLNTGSVPGITDILLSNPYQHVMDFHCLLTCSISKIH